MNGFKPSEELAKEVIEFWAEKHRQQEKKECTAAIICCALVTVVFIAAFILSYLGLP